ncbi:hypothetical protein CPB83DRAFT_838630 [Crepidotus variabilis]|uniref:Uncharacterized protein n=1 Tax=Crepidotus variabilis TaxID=179855 RepID=A0A9P6JLM7_9AGAR|nr:hypothetical protein CPB83DRAFT_838630 [Crepidotus variabilis]
MTDPSQSSSPGSTGSSITSNPNDNLSLNQRLAKYEAQYRKDLNDLMESAQAVESGTGSREDLSHRLRSMYGIFATDDGIESDEESEDEDNDDEGFNTVPSSDSGSEIDDGEEESCSGGGGGDVDEFKAAVEEFAEWVAQEIMVEVKLEKGNGEWAEGLAPECEMGISWSLPKVFFRINDRFD